MIGVFGIPVVAFCAIGEGQLLVLSFPCLLRLTFYSFRAPDKSAGVRTRAVVGYGDDFGLVVQWALLFASPTWRCGWFGLACLFSRVVSAGFALLPFRVFLLQETAR